MSAIKNIVKKKIQDIVPLTKFSVSSLPVEISYNKYIDKSNMLYLYGNNTERKMPARYTANDETYHYTIPVVSAGNTYFCMNAELESLRQEYPEYALKGSDTVIRIYCTTSGCVDCPVIKIVNKDGSVKFAEFKKRNASGNLYYYVPVNPDDFTVNAEYYFFGFRGIDGINANKKTYDVKHISVSGTLVAEYAF